MGVYVKLCPTHLEITTLHFSTHIQKNVPNLIQLEYDRRKRKQCDIINVTEIHVITVSSKKENNGPTALGNVTPPRIN